MSACSSTHHKELNDCQSSPKFTSTRPPTQCNKNRADRSAPPACVLPRPVSGDGSSQGSGRRHPQGSRARRTSACWPPWARELDVFKINILR
ncbi:MAG: hypothetical protein M0Q13_01550 [Methanothrix sp.]|nr:hypothetical protein [Methanothrix sp.]